ncbi:acetyltransferase [Firmicutes bacterium AM41-11]|nr:acetyltransferase [Firmicutes bacterium AM41-11]
MKYIFKICGGIILQIDRMLDYCRKEYKKSKFNECGDDVYIGTGCIFTEKNITLGNKVYIGARCVFQSTYGKIYIGNHIMFGPGVNIHGGNHKIREIGRLMDDVSLKQQGDDGIITIEDDCWIGANAVILSNVTIGKGSIIGSGSVVTKDVPPYSIYTGVNSVVIRPRFDIENQTKHIEKLKERYGDDI